MFCHSTLVWASASTGYAVDWLVHRPRLVLPSAQIRRLGCSANLADSEDAFQDPNQV